MKIDASFSVCDLQQLDPFSAVTSNYLLTHDPSLHLTVLSTHVYPWINGTHLVYIFSAGCQFLFLRQCQWERINCINTVLWKECRELLLPINTCSWGGWGYTWNEDEDIHIMLFIETVVIKVHLTYTLQTLLAISQAMMTAIQILWFACVVFTISNAP
jgi:hypothetical protein